MTKEELAGIMAKANGGAAVDQRDWELAEAKVIITLLAKQLGNEHGVGKIYITAQEVRALDPKTRLCAERQPNGDYMIWVEDP